MMPDTDTGSGSDQQPTDAAGNALAPATSGSHAAAHLLEITARDAELWVSEARSEAAALLDQARAEAEALLASARSEAEQVRAEVDEARRGQEAEVAELHRLAGEHRDRLRRHLTDLLSQVTPPGAGDDDPDGDHH